MASIRILERDARTKQIVYVTGSRAEYGRMRSVLFSIIDKPMLRLSLIVTGMHLAEEFGSSFQEIERDGFRIDATINALPNRDTGAAMVEAMSECMKGVAEALQQRQYDLVMVTGDRGEVLGASLAAKHLNIPVAHVGGGHVSGSIDNRIRDAVTIFSDIHFTANEICAKRVIDLGANPRDVFVVGAPDLDAVRKKEFASPEKVAKDFNLDLDEPIILVSQHPVTTEVHEATAQMRETMEAIRMLGLQTIVTYANADAGGRAMNRVLTEYEYLPFVKIYKTIPYGSYLGLMNVADVLVGNSSCGIIEGPSFDLPVVNIGTRQDGRLRAKNVIDVRYGRRQILAGIKRARSREFRRLVRKCKNPYGDGRTGRRIAGILARAAL